MNRVKKAGVALAMVGSSLAGGAVGAALFSGGSAGAATSNSNTAPSSPGNNAPAAAPGGTFHSNENAAHEATESPQREAQENAGQAPTVP